ncbi:MAG: CvpA family protein [Lachnospiraceae bacterium]|jgi:uncharacterized membrane protein required for colicin V production
MNVLTIAIAAILLISMISGGKKGLVKVLFSLAAAVVTILIVMAFEKPFENFLRENTGMYDFLETQVSGFVQERVSSAQSAAGNSLTSQMDALSLPAVVSDAILTAVESAGAKTASAVTAAITAALTGIVFTAAAWLILFVAVRIAVSLVGMVLNAVVKLPVLRQVNAVAGAMIGLFFGLVVVWLVFLLITACTGFPFGEQCMQWINESAFLEFLYNRNPLMTWQLL